MNKIQKAINNELLYDELNDNEKLLYKLNSFTLESMTIAHEDELNEEVRDRLLENIAQSANIIDQLINNSK